ncbi:MAG TPA: CDP-alcohol phosphatidyltransferase family protein [Allosphingosinicella sp.]
MASTSASPGAIATPMPPAHVKPRELADPLNHYLFHPLANRLAAMLRPTGITPNTVSLISGMVVMAATLAYLGLDRPLSVLLGFALHLSWHVFDGADGELARLTGKSTPFGELVDGVADYAGHIVLYLLLAWSLEPWLGLWAYGLVAASGASRIAQSNHAETQRRTYLWRVYGVPWLKQAKESGDSMFAARGLLATIFVDWFARGYIKLAGATSPDSARIDSAIAAASGNDRETARLRQLCRADARASILLQHALGANPRTIILGLAMIAGSPIWFFLVETTILNVVLAVSILHQRRRDRSIVARLDPAPPGRG